MDKLKTKKNRHGMYRLEYHIVLVTKYRKPCITEALYQDLYKETVRLFQNWDIELLEMNYEPDHIHMLISTTPQLCLGTMINSYKSVTSRIIRRLYEKHLAEYYWKPYFWNRSYLILSSGGASIETIKKYIQNQKKDAAIAP